MIDPSRPIAAQLKKQRRSRFSFSLLSIFLITACVAVSVFFVTSFQASGVGFSEQRDIREFLEENLDSGSWEEVRWYPPAMDGSAKFVRVKLRTKNRYGASELLDLVFSFNGQEFRSWGSDSSMFYYFWDAAGQPRDNAKSPLNELADDISSGKYRVRDQRK